MLIKMKFFAENLSMFDSKINAEIDEMLKNYKIKVGRIAFMKLSIALEKTDVGARVIAEHASLAGEDVRRLRDKMQKQDDITYVLGKLDGTDLDKDILYTETDISNSANLCLRRRFLQNFKFNMIPIAVLYLGKTTYHVR